jgi:hypothetical protein
MPMDIPLSVPAKRRFVHYVDEHGREQAETTVGELSAVWFKLEAYAARFALIFHLVRLVANDNTLLDAEWVDQESIDAGIRLSDWLGNEARRIYAVLAESEAEQETRELVELIQRRGGEVTVRDIMRASRKYSTAEEVEAALNDLAGRDYGAWYTLEHPGPGRPASVFRLTPSADTDTNNFFPHKTAIVSTVSSKYQRKAEG